MQLRTCFTLIAIVACASVSLAAQPLGVLIVDGQNNHDWRATTPVLRWDLESTGLFKVDVATSPPKDTAGFRPEFKRYAAVLLNYNGQPWPRETEQALVDYVHGGGGLVVVHAANNSFPEWKEFNDMIGLGGWGGRNEKSGPKVYLADGKIVRDTKAGAAGNHGTQHPFEVVVRDARHPITAGMPRAWLHAQDELYDSLRGPAENLTVLATAYSDPATHGSGRHEPMIFTVTYGKGRVFHTPMGHNPTAMMCVGFITTLVRGTEWAATGSVTQKIPADFPSAGKTSLRKLPAAPAKVSALRPTTSPGALAAAAAAPTYGLQHKAHVVFVTGDDEYRSEITMPMLAKILEKQHGLRTTVLYARPTPTSKQNIEGLAALDTADLAVFFLRFRALPEEQLTPILNYVGSGKPIVGLRTSTHSFQYPPGHPRVALNDDFGRDVFGQKWLYHHGHTSSTDVSIVPERREHPILRGVEPRFHVASWLYHVLPLEGKCMPLLVGDAVHSEQKTQATEPVAWVKSDRKGKVFFTTLGHPQDFEVASVRRLLVNAVLWSLGGEVPAGGAAADLPSGYVTPPTH